MNTKEISGQRQYDFVSKFNYSREAGTIDEKRAADAILEELAQFGARGVSESFPVNAFRILNAQLIITEPYEKEYTVTGYGFCGNTPKTGLEAPFLYVEDGDEISLSHARDKIVLINNRVREDMLKKIAEAGALGFVSITGTPLDTGVDRLPLSCRISKREAPLPQLPGVNLHYLDAVEIVTKGASRARLILRQEESVHTSQNLVLRVEGTDKADEIISLTAHYDSVPEGPGAYDNMAGCSIILELCRYFRKHPARRTLEFIFFGAEEKGLVGSKYYVTSHKQELHGHQLNMNVDLAGQLVGGTVIGVTGDAGICKLMMDLAREIGLGLSVKHQVWSSDSNSFAREGVPAFTMGRDGFGLHTRHDTLDLISPWSLERSAVLLGHIAERIGNMETLPFPRTVPEEFIEALKQAP